MTMRRPTRGMARRASGDSSGRFRLTGAIPLLTSLLTIALALMVPAFPAPAQTPDSNEYRLKLAFLYNFAQFVQWPEDSFRDSTAPLVICVAGENPFQGDIEASLQGRTVRGHPLQLRGLRLDDDPRNCQMVFVRAGERKDLAKILASSKGSNVLTVGEARGFAESGGIINLTREANKLRFEVNINAAAQSRLKLSSKLLALARIVGE